MLNSAEKSILNGHRTSSCACEVTKFMSPALRGEVAFGAQETDGATSKQWRSALHEPWLLSLQHLRLPAHCQFRLLLKVGYTYTYTLFRNHR